MAEGIVILASRRSPLRPFLFRRPISSRLMPLPWERRIEHTMKRAENRRTEFDARRSALMAAAQTGDRAAYETLLRDCVSFIVSVARRRVSRLAALMTWCRKCCSRHTAPWRPMMHGVPSMRGWESSSNGAQSTSFARCGDVALAKCMHHWPTRAMLTRLSILRLRMEQKEKVNRIGAALAELPPRQRQGGAASDA